MTVIRSDYMIHAADCHEELVAALDTCLLFIGEALRDGRETLPSPAWHGWKHFQNIVARAKSARNPEAVDD